MGFVSELSDFGRQVVAEMQLAAGDPEPRSVEKNLSSVRSGSVDQHAVDKKKLERYWDLYKEVPIIRNPIRSFASEVVAPGYYVETQNEDLKKDLEEWLHNSAIVDGEIDKDFRHLLKKATIQREVKGSAMAEKVMDEEGNLYGFKLIRPETVRAFTFPGQSMLLPPDADIDGSDQNGYFSGRDYYTTEDDEAAAYVQLTSSFNNYDGNKSGYIAFTRDKIIKLTRDADTGEVFGTSRLHAVEDRLESLLKKLDDNDKAIESVSHPYMLFKLGTGDQGPWAPEKIEQLAREHEQERYEPGLKQFVQGDVDVDQISGDVADIESFLNFDVNWIISEMPLPKYALGGFEEDVNQFVSRSQETRIEKQIQEAREEIQDEWTPILEEKAEEMDYDPEEIEGLVIGEDPENFTLKDVKETEKQNKNRGEGGTNFTRPKASSEKEGKEQDEELSEEEVEMLRNMRNHYQRGSEP